MHNWEALVGSRLGSLRLCAETERDVLRELASHVEQIYDHARESGANDAQAHALAMGSAGDWRRLAAHIHREKENHMTTTPFRRRVLVPGLVSLAFASLSMALVHSIGYRGHENVYQMFRMQDGLFVVFNIPWLLSLPIAGALGAWASLHAGGDRWQRCQAAMFPALLYSWALLMGIGTAVVWMTLVWLVPNRVGDHAGFMTWMARIMSLALPWVLAPAVSSLLGALPFVWLRTTQPKPTVEAAHI